MIYKKIIFAFLMCSLLLFSSCDTEETETSSVGTFIGGTAGVVAEFVNLNPPTEFDQSSAVPLKVLLKNMGESQIASGKASVKVFSPSPSSLGISDTYKSTSGELYELDDLTKTGGEQEIDFGKISYKPDVTNEEHITLRARYCYDYNTHANIDVCLKSKTSAEADESICSTDGEKVGSGMVSSAPVQVTSVLEDPRPNKVQFAIKIVNQGTGIVYNPASSCINLDDDDTRLTEKNKLDIKITSPVEIECDFKDGESSSEGTITLNENKEYILRCWKDIEETLEDKLKITLTYKYRDQIKKEVTVLED